MNGHDETPLTIPEAARRMGVSDQVARLALLRGELRGFRIGRQWRVYPASVAEVMARHQGGEAA
jgi:excisionase family DNA binding protein